MNDFNISCIFYEFIVLDQNDNLYMKSIYMKRTIFFLFYMFDIRPFINSC